MTDVVYFPPLHPTATNVPTNVASYGTRGFSTNNNASGRKVASVDGDCATFPPLYFSATAVGQAWGENTDPRPEGITSARRGWPFKSDNKIQLDGLVQNQDEDSASDEEEQEEEDIKKSRAEYRRNVNTVRSLIQDFLCLDPSEEDDWHTMQVLLAFPPKTVANWGSHWRVMLKSGYKLTPRSFFSYVLNIVYGKNLSNGTVKQARGAIRAWYKISGMAGEQVQAETLIQGLISSHKDRGVGKRGGIECHMCRELISHPKFNHKFRDAFILLSASGLRQGELARSHLMQWQEQIDASGKKIWVVTIPRSNKGNPTAQQNLSVERHHCNPYWTAEISEIIGRCKGRADGRKKSPLLLPGWNPTEARKEIKNMVVILRKEWKKTNDQDRECPWSENLQWVLHSFRHGAAIDAFVASAGQSALERIRSLHNVTGHMTISMLRYYSETNYNRELMEQHRRNAVDFRRRTGGQLTHSDFRMGVLHVRRRSAGLVGDDQLMKQVLLEAGMKQKTKDPKRGDVVDFIEGPLDQDVIAVEV